MRYLRNRFLAGLLIITPAAVTWWILWKFFTAVDGILDPVRIRYPVIDHPGVGVAVVVVLIILVGIFAGNLIGHRVISLGERLLYRLPLVRRIYHAVKELAGVFLADRKMVFKRVVFFRYPHHDSYALGFVTSEGTRRIDAILERRVLHVFVPTTPNPTSGFMLLLPADDVVDVPIDVEDAMKMIISGGVYVPPEFQDPGSAPPPITFAPFDDDRPRS